MCRVYVSITFILTTFLTFALFIYAICQTVFESIVGNILIFLIPFWIVFQAVPALSGFYLSADAVCRDFPFSPYFPHSI